MDDEFGEKFKIARNKFNAFGPLGVTAEDHKNIGSTPPEILLMNPGKTEFDLMSDEDLLNWLNGKKEELVRFSSKEFSVNVFVQSYLPTLKEEIKATLDFLRLKKRLPEEHHAWKIE